MQELVELYKVLSDETRIRILSLLYKQDLCVCELTELLHLPQPKISKHIAKIRNSHLVSTKRNEQFIYYSFNHDNSSLVEMMEMILKSNNNVLLEDLKMLENKPSFVCTKVVI